MLCMLYVCVCVCCVCYVCVWVCESVLCRKPFTLTFRENFLWPHGPRRPTRRAVRSARHTGCDRNLLASLNLNWNNGSKGFPGTVSGSLYWELHKWLDLTMNSNSLTIEIVMTTCPARAQMVAPAPTWKMVANTLWMPTLWCRVWWTLCALWPIETVIFSDAAIQWWWCRSIRSAVHRSLCSPDVSGRVSRPKRSVERPGIFDSTRTAWRPAVCRMSRVWRISDSRNSGTQCIFSFSFCRRSVRCWVWAAAAMIYTQRPATPTPRTSSCVAVFVSRHIQAVWLSPNTGPHWLRTNSISTRYTTVDQTTPKCRRIHRRNSIRWALRWAGPLASPVSLRINR